MSQETELAAIRPEITEVVLLATPHIAPASPDIVTHLSDGTANKSGNLFKLRASALDTIESYPEAIWAYTDGSAKKTAARAGYGVYVEFPDGSCENEKGSCGSYRSNYEARRR